MLALGLLRTLNRFRLYLQEVIVARKGYLPNELRYQSNRRRHSIAFLIEYVLSSEEETEMAMLASPKMFSCMATEKAARTFPSPATAHLSSILICSTIAIYVQSSTSTSLEYHQALYFSYPRVPFSIR
jgi:hypothetical protein